MRIIKINTEEEKQIVCDRCSAVLGYLKEDVKTEYNKVSRSEDCCVSYLTCLHCEHRIVLHRKTFSTAFRYR